jgi:hypothetical protein
MDESINILAGSIVFCGVPAAVYHHPAAGDAPIDNKTGGWQ